MTMDTPLSTPPLQPQGTFSEQSSRSRSSTKLADDVMSLTSFNPFSEEDEDDQSAYASGTSIFSRMKNFLPWNPVTAGTTSRNIMGPNLITPPNATEPRRPSFTLQTQSSFSSTKTSGERPTPLIPVTAQIAPPLVSLTPAQSEVPTYNIEYERSPSRNGAYYSPVAEPGEGGIFGTSIPGFPIQDDARSIRTTHSLQHAGFVSKVIRRTLGEGLSRDYWMDDEHCKECYDCKSIFTTWRRKHHCRICGQIFCSRCASNVIKGSRFGQDGRVRVCNLCLEKLAQGDDEDEDDRRSVVSSVTSFPAHQLGNDGLGHIPQSPFAASQLFGHISEPFNLYSIAETKRRISGSEGSDEGRRMMHISGTRPDAWQPVKDNPAPFRRALSEDPEDPTNISNAAVSENTQATPQKKIHTGLPSSLSFPTEGLMSSIQFPIGSPERLTDISLPPSQVRPRFNSYGEFEVATPFIRSRVQSRLDSIITAEPGWRTRRESTAYAQELNFTSMLHLKVMLRQMLTNERIPNIKEWEETLLKLALRIARELTFTALPHRQGEDMDVRRYVKIKKIPGGMPRDSEYVDGAVITKNVAHKQMFRFQRNPRIMLITFPLEFFRVEGQYMHFGQVVRQEKEYLGNLATRIAALRPHVVLVEQSVSRLALDALAKLNIAVARSVKPSAIHAISRMTQGDVFSSMDKLALEPRLGHCARFRIQTFDHALIPGRRKTYMRFEGCNRDMGCTIILRGGDIDVLRRIKKVTRFLTFVVRNLKLETHLWKDSVITLPPFNSDAIPASMGAHKPSLPLLSLQRSSATTPQLNTPTVPSNDVELALPIPNDTDDEPNEDAIQLRLSQRIDQSLEPYRETFISVSATLRFPPPYPIRRMKELDVELHEAKRIWEDDLVQREEKRPVSVSHQQEATITQAVFGDEKTNLKPQDSEDLSAQIDALPAALIPRSSSPSSMEETSTPDTSEGSMSQSRGGSNISSVSSVPSSVESSIGNLPAEPREPLVTVGDIALQSRYSLLRWQHEEQRRIWEWYLRKNHDDLVVEKYQCISLWEYTIPAADFGLHRPCFVPQLRYVTFYGENDCTLGQYIEKSVGDTLRNFLDPKAICLGKGCDQPLARHCKVYVHNETRLFVAVEQWDGQIIRSNFLPTPDLITTWSACRVCGSATPFIPVSEEMQRYSFAKFLELHFYPADVKLVQGAGCEHNIYQHHVRFFASKGMTVRFQADPIVLHEVVYPPFRIRVRPENQLEMKNTDFDRLHHRNLLWYTGLIDDLTLISIEAATGDEELDAKLLSDINSLISRAESEREEISKLINAVYRESAPTDTLALNQVHAFRQDKIVAWQQDFDRLPKPSLPQLPADRNSKRGSTFGSVRAMWPRRYDLSGAFDHPHLPSSSVSEAEEGPLSNTRRVSTDSLASSASSEHESEPNTDMAEKSAAEPGSSPNEVRAGPLAVLGEKSSKSDPESDSTIGAAREDALDTVDESQVAPKEENGPPQRTSRLPRRVSNQPSVAELVKKYQEFLPPSGIEDLTRTALAPPPPVSESEQEYPPTFYRRPPARNKNRQPLVRQPSTSDFEQSYAANIAPRYLTYPRKPLASSSHSSRIPGPAMSAFDSHESSRRPSPEKPSAGRRPREVKFDDSGFTAPTTSSRLKPRVGVRSKDKAPAPPRPSSAPISKSTLRKPSATMNSKVSNIAKHFERLGRDAERTKSRYTVIRGKRARPVASARAKLEVLESIKDAIGDESDSSGFASEADNESEQNDDKESAKGYKHSKASLPAEPEVTESTSPGEEGGVTAEGGSSSVSNPALLVTEPPAEASTLPPSPFLSATQPSHDALMTPPLSESEAGATGVERHSILKAISGLWLQPQPLHRNSLEIDDPMKDPEHIFRDSSMVVRTDEPTSIIAWALNSPQYRDMLSKSRAEKRTAREVKLTDSGEAFMPDDRSVAESNSTWGVLGVDSAESADPTEDLRVPSSKLPWAISFESGGLTISCTILYPEQFDALRRTYDCEKSIVESLARCVKWNASGGKSGSAFLKTRDGRFIAKELSKPELQTMETFAPAYFDYMSSAISANRPTLLAKVFGCYKITFKKAGKESSPVKTKAAQMNLLVMENLFYDRRFTKIYDLKGSTRNRHVQSTGRENEVLLDENLVETAHLNPFYLREHSKRILRGALYNDSKFLAEINVMDYSLVCGVDSQNNELVVGIVDYIRTYTWDKKLESWVKESTFLGGATRGEPTIVTPRQYRQRFISAMERYFPLIPDRWMKHKDTPEEDPNSLLELWPDW